MWCTMGARVLPENEEKPIFNNQILTGKGYFASLGEFEPLIKMVSNSKLFHNVMWQREILLRNIPYLWLSVSATNSF